MAITLLVGPAASGKTAACVTRARQVLLQRPLAPVWIVLPDRIQTSYVRRRMADEGGVMGGRAGTFGDLYRDLLGRAGISVPVATRPVVQQLVRAAVDDVVDNGELPLFAPIAHTPGFVRAAVERIAELKRARIDAPRFLTACESERLLELGRIYQAYQRRLQTLGWADAEGLSWLAVEAVEGDATLAAEWALLAVDGFDDFVGSQIDALVAFARSAPEILVTLPGTDNMERTAHRRFRHALETLTNRAGATTENTDDHPHLPGQIRALERALFEPDSPPATNGTEIEWLEVRSPADEAREALRWIKGRHLRDGVSLSQCAVVTPDPERYRPFLREVGAEFGLPLRFTEGDPLVSSPGITALVDLLDLPLRGFPRRLTIEAVRAPQFDLRSFGFEAPHGDLLEAASRAGNVIEGLEQWEDALRRLADRDPRLVSHDDGSEVARPLPCGAEATALLKSLHQLANRLAPDGRLPVARAMGEWAAWLEDLLDDMGFPRVTTGSNDAGPAPSSTFDERERSGVEALRSVLDALALADTLVTMDRVDYAGFVTHLRGMVGSATYGARMNWHEERVLIAKVLDARGPRFDAVALLGLAEGVFPQIEREDPFLDENTRRRLGLEPRLGREQRGLFYLAATRADRFLLLTRPYLAEGGQKWEPSPYWTATLAAFGKEPDEVRPVRPDDPRTIEDAASGEELLFWSVRRGRLPSHAEASFGARWEHLRTAREVVAGRQAPELPGPGSIYDGDAGAITGELAQRFGSEHTWSPSRFEKYGSCPLWFFAETVLDLEAQVPPEPGIDARQLGSLLHDVLERAYRDAAYPTDPESVLDVLAPIAREAFEAAPERYGFRPTALWATEREQMVDKLEDTVRGLGELSDSWTPVGLEASFGMRGQPPLKIEVDGESVRLRGVIDRVDRNAAGELRVLDYKTGSGKLAKRDLVEGHRLQLPLYAQAARDALHLGQPIDGLYWAILAGRPGTLRLAGFEHETDGTTFEGPDGAMRLAREHVAESVRGVRGGRFAPHPPRDGCPSYCTAALWCWRYTPRRDWS